MKNLQMILSIVGAAAWLPIIFKFFVSVFRKIHAVYLDNECIHNVQASIYDGEKLADYKGMILLLALNLFVYGKPFFPKCISCELELNNGGKHKAELYEGEIIVREENKCYKYEFPTNININYSRSIIPDLNNIRIMPFCFEGLNLYDDKSIKKIKMIFKGRFFSKRLILSNKNCVRMKCIHQYSKLKD